MAGRMHAARLTASPRLRRVADVLADGLPHSTLAIVERAQVCAVNSAVAELRENGLSIRCWREGEIWYYQLFQRPSPTGEYTQGDTHD